LPVPPSPSGAACALGTTLDDGLCKANPVLAVLSSARVLYIEARAGPRRRASPSALAGLTAWPTSAGVAGDEAARRG
jgi:hypothetical protein